MNEPVVICPHIDPDPGGEAARWCECETYAFVTLHKCMTRPVAEGSGAAHSSFAIRRRTDEGRPLG